jgi:hypothetical protein
LICYNKYIELLEGREFGWHTPKFFERLKCKSQNENNGRRKSCGMVFGSKHFGDKRDMLEVWDGD